MRGRLTKPDSRLEAPHGHHESTPSADAPARSAAHPAATIVLLVRHGQTPTTGKVLPGRATGLHLADEGASQADIAAERIACAEARRRDLQLAARTRQGDRRADRQTRGLRTQIDRGLLECDFGDWTGAELKKLMKLPEWGTVQRAPSTFRFPGGESFTEMQTRMVVDARPAPRARIPAARSCASRTPTRSRPPSPTPWARTSTCSSASSSAPLGHRHRAGGRAGRSCSPSTRPADRSPTCSRARRWACSTSSTTSTRSPSAPRAGPASGRSSCRRGPTAERVTVKCEKQQAAAIVQYLRRVLSDLPPADDRPMPSALELIEPLEASLRPRPDRPRLRPGHRSSAHPARGGRRGRRGGRDHRRRRPGPRPAVRRTAARPSAFCERADDVIEAGRPTCRWCGNPIDPDGHLCPRMN